MVRDECCLSDCLFCFLGDYCFCSYFFQFTTGSSFCLRNAFYKKKTLNERRDLNLNGSFIAYWCHESLLCAEEPTTHLIDPTVFTQNFGFNKKDFSCDAGFAVQSIIGIPWSVFLKNWRMWKWCDTSLQWDFNILEEKRIKHFLFNRFFAFSMYLFLIRANHKWYLCEILWSVTS